MPYVIDFTDGGVPEKARRPWVEWGPAEQERNLREALGSELYEWLNEEKTEVEIEAWSPFP